MIQQRDKQNRRPAFAGALFLLAALGCLLLPGCAPSVSIQVQRAPNWKTAGIKRVAVMPFEHGRSREQAETARHLTNDAATRLAQMNHFTLVSAAEVERLRTGGERIENHVDALFTGKIITIDSDDNTRTEQRYDRETKETIDVTVYIREVSMTVSYSLELTRDGSVVGIATRTATASDKQYSSSSLKSTSDLLRECAVLRGLRRDLVPYTVTESRRLMDEASKDRELKAKMKDAAAHVKQKSYKTALNAYLEIYGRHGNPAAIYNAGIMLEATGDIRAAIELMQRAQDETGNPKFAMALDRLNRQLEESETVDNEYKNPVRQIDRAIGHASSEALRTLKPGARVWFVKDERTESALVNSVADGMASALIKGGVTVVDREHTRLIEDELMLQMSGSVSDSDLLRAGNLAGANTIVTVAVSGTGSMRRLQLRILDVETGIPLMMSDTGDKWNL